MEKTTSDVGKIISDIIQITSDLFSAIANIWKTNRCTKHALFGHYSANQLFTQLKRGIFRRLHYLALSRSFVVDAAQVEYAVDYHAVKLVLV